MIQLTQCAADHVQEMLDKRGHGTGLRLATRKAGCSGYTYKIDYADQINADDIIFESFDIKIVVDKNSLPYINGSEIDYLKTSEVNQGFKFNNPNVHDLCGCGESFNTER